VVDDVLTTLEVGWKDSHFHVEATRSKERLVEVVSSIGRTEDDDSLVLLETIHLREELIDRLVGVRVDL